MAEITVAEPTEAGQSLKEITFDAPGTAYLEGPGRLVRLFHCEPWISLTEDTFSQ